MIAGELSRNSEMLFRVDVEKGLLEKYGSMELPVEVLKKWLVRRNEELTAENIDEEYNKMENGLKWQLIKERIADLCEVKVEEQDLINHAKMIAAMQFAQYGMTNMDDDTLTDYAKRILADKNYRPRIVEEVGDAKLFAAIKEKVSVDTKPVSIDEFKEIASKQQ
jgi:trigger factor